MTGTLYVIFSTVVLLLCSDILAERRPIFTVHAKVEKKPTSDTLQVPYNVNYEIKEDALVVSWKYRELKSNVGFNVGIQEAATSVEKFPVNYVKVQKGLSFVEIRGLKPKTSYNLKVIAFTKDNEVGSRAIKVNTNDLSFLQAQNLSASSINDTSAVFSWSYEGDIQVHDIQFKLLCSGNLKYTNNEGEDINEEVLFERLISSKTLSYEAKGLVPNTLYTCSLNAVANIHVSESNTAIDIRTLPGKPPHPKKPVIETYGPKNHTFSVKFYKSSNIFGPISHYAILAIPVKRSPIAAHSMPYNPMVPVSQILTKAVSLDMSVKVPDKLPFVLGEYSVKDYPHVLKFNGAGVMEKAFKPETYYAFAVVVYGQNKDSNRTQYSMSDLSDPPIYVGKHMTEEWIKLHRPTVRHFVSIIIAVAMFIIVILSLLMLIAVGLAYMRQRNRIQRFTIGDDGSEEDIYVRKPKVKKIRKNAKSKKYSRLEKSKEGEYYDPIFEETVRNKERIKQIKQLSAKHDQQVPQKTDNKQLYSVVTPPDSPREQFVEANQHNQQLATHGILPPSSESPRFCSNNFHLCSQFGPQNTSYYASYGHNPHFIPQGPNGECSLHGQHDFQCTTQYFQQPSHNLQCSPHHYPPPHCSQCAPQHSPRDLSHDLHHPAASQYLHNILQDNQEQLNLEESILASSYTRPRCRRYNLPNSFNKNGQMSQEQHSNTTDKAELPNTAFQQMTIVDIASQKQHQQNTSMPGNDRLTGLIPKSVSPNTQAIQYQQNMSMPDNDRLIPKSISPNTQAIQNISIPGSDRLIPKSVSPNTSQQQAIQYQQNMSTPGTNRLSYASQKVSDNIISQKQVSIPQQLFSNEDTDKANRAYDDNSVPIVYNKISPRMKTQEQTTSATDSLPVSLINSSQNSTDNPGYNQLQSADMLNDSSETEGIGIIRKQASPLMVIDNTHRGADGKQSPVIVVDSITTEGARDERLLQQQTSPHKLNSSVLNSASNDDNQQQQISPRTLLNEANVGEIKPNTELMREHSVRFRPVVAKNSTSVDVTSLIDEDDEMFDAMSEQTTEVEMPLPSTTGAASSSNSSESKKNEKDKKVPDKDERYSSQSRSPVKNSTTVDATSLIDDDEMFDAVSEQTTDTVPSTASQKGKKKTQKKTQKDKHSKRHSLLFRSPATKK